MKLSERCVQMLLCVCAALGGLIQHAVAQTYPAKPIRFVLGFSPGGPTDIVARLVGQKLTESLAVPVIVDTRPGGDSTIATGIVARAAPDGYTLLMISPSATIHPSVYAKLPYSITKDFAPVTVLAASSYIVVVNPVVPARSMKALIAIAKARPGQLNYGGAGIGDGLHMAGELLQSMAGFKMQLITYHGGGPAMTALIGGHVDLMISPIGIALPHIKSGKVRALAVSGPKRSPSLPDLPTIAEAAVPGYAVTGWYGLLAPGGTPGTIIERLNTEISKALKLPDTQQKLAGMSMEPVGNSPSEMANHLETEIAKWAKIAKQANIPLKSF